jgi:hypothetical protein
MRNNRSFAIVEALFVSVFVAATHPFFVEVSYAEAKPLEIRAQFFYEDENKEIRPLTNQSVLKSGQYVGIAFRSQENSHIYVLWNDSSGKMGVLFPNPALTDNIPEVIAGKSYWLPSKDSERWYVLDDNPGTETIYFIAARNPNPKLEELIRSLNSSSGLRADAGDYSSRRGEGRAYRRHTGPAELGPESAAAVKRELNMMGFAQVTVPKGVEKASYETKQELFDNLEQTIRVSGAQAMLKVQFQHVDSH